MPLLYYWRGDNHRHDLDFGVGYHLNQANRLMHRIDIGDSVWAFTRRRDGAYVMAAELVVRARTINSSRFDYGAYRVWGDLRLSRYFMAEGQASIEQVIRSLSPRATAKHLGQSFQGPAAVRRLTPRDHQVLRVVCDGLSLEPRARLLPEERLEATLFASDAGALADLLRDEVAGLAGARRRYLYRTVPMRSQALARELRDRYAGRCQLCEWSPKSHYGVDLCEAHHIEWLSRGGQDDLSNLMLLCPNHHRAVHACDAHLDYGDLALHFGARREPLALDTHLREFRRPPDPA